MSKKLSLTLSVAVALSSACGLQPTNPFDPESLNPAPGSVSGTVQAVFARDAEGQPAGPGACAPVEGDHSGFSVVLRGVRARGEGINASTTETNESGAFLFQGVPPGRYTLELVRAGFAVPPVAEIVVGVGEARELGAFCALNATGPARPVLATLPAVVRADGPAPLVEVVDVDTACDPAGADCPVAYVIRQAVDGVAEVLATTVPLDSAKTELVLGAGPGTRRAVRVEVSALDALGNEGAPAATVIVVDGITPPPPTGVRADAGRDRVSISWQPGAATAEDDLPSSFVVFYGLAERVAGQSCPFGAPVFDDTGSLVDDNGRASFALEGPSPLLTDGVSQQLSGVAPGTEVVVHVAALDAAGNAGCYSAPVRARPDDVTFAEAPARSGVVATGAVAMQSVGGASRGAVVAARGSGGSSVLDRNGSNTVDATPAFDVTVDGNDVYFAAGALGVRAITLGADGAPVAGSERLIGTTSPVRSVLTLPGRLAVGTDTGLAIVDLEGAAGAEQDPGGRGEPVIALASWGRFLVVVRGVGSQARVQLVDRVDADGPDGPDGPDDPRAELGLLAVIPEDVLVHDDALWLALGDQGVLALELRGCESSGACLSVIGRRALPGAVPARELAGYDDRVLVAGEADDEAAVFALARDAALTVKGRFELGAGSPAGLFVEDGGACAALAEPVGDTLACAASISAFFVDEERRYASGKDIKRSRAGKGAAFALESGDALAPSSITAVDLATMTTRRTASLPNDALGRPAQPVAGTLLDDGTFVVLDNTARLFALAPTDPASGTARLVAALAPDVVALLPALGDPEDPNRSGVEGFLERRGSELLLALSTPDGAGLLRARLEEDNGILEVAAPTAADAVEIEGARQFTKIVLTADRALLPTQPFGLVAVELDGPLAVVAGESLAPEAEPSSFAADAGLALVGGEPSLVVVGKRGLPGGGVGAGLFVIDGGSVSATLGAPDEVIADARSLSILRDRLVVGTRSQGVVVLGDVTGQGQSYVPLVALPGASQVTEPVSTARGVLVSDGAGGMLYAVLR